GVAEALRIGIRRACQSIGPGFSQHASPLVELQESIFRLDDLKGSAEEQNTRITERIALAGGIVSQGGRNGSRAVRWLMRVELLLPPDGHCRRLLTQALGVASPNSGQVVGVVWNARTGILNAAPGVGDRKSTR